VRDPRKGWFGAPGQPPTGLPPAAPRQPTPPLGLPPAAPRQPTPPLGLPPAAPRQRPTPPLGLPPAAPLAVEPLETDMMRLPDGGRRRKIVIAVGATAVVVAAFIGLRASRHAPHVPPPKPVAAPAPEPVAPAAPAAAPAREVEIALDPGGSARPASSGAAAREAVPATDETPRVRHRRHEHRKAHRRAPHHASRAAHERKLAKNKRKPNPAGDREAAHAAYQRGNSELLTDNDAAAAVAAYQEAVRLAPSDPSGYRGLGLAYEKQGKIPDAIAALVSYLKLSKHAHDREVIARRLYRLTHPHDD
jgi:hypothetical protein